MYQHSVNRKYALCIQNIIYPLWGFIIVLCVFIDNSLNPCRNCIFTLSVIIYFIYLVQVYIILLCFISEDYAQLH
jgi:hypothetical protein